MRGIDHAEDWGWANAPRKPGGGSNTVQTQSGPPAQVLANYSQVYGQGQNVAQQPYPTYNSSVIAGFQPQQIAGFNAVNQAANAGVPFLNSASNYTTNAADLLNPQNFGSTQQAYVDTGLAPYLSGAQGNITAGLGTSTAASGGLTGANFGNTIGNYYNPYAQSVIAPTQALFNEQNAQQLQQVRGNAAAQGAFGGDREAIAEAQTAQQQQLAEAPVLAQLQSTGYAQAVQNALAAAQQGQTTAGLQLQGAGQMAGLGNLQLQQQNAATGAAQANAWLNSQAGFGMGNLAGLAQNQGLAGANAEIAAGGLQQQQAQAELNAPYQAFLQAQGYPYQTTGWLEGLATGTGALSGTQGSTSYPSPSTASQVAGLGLAGAGILGETGAFGNSANNGSGWLSNLFGSGGDSGYVDSGTFAVGGRIPARAPGGSVPTAGLGGMGAPLAFDPSLPDAAGIPNVDVNIIPMQAGLGQNLLGSSTGSTSTTSGGGSNAGSQALGAVGDVAKVAGLVALLRNGGGIYVPRHLQRRDDGGGIGAGTTAPGLQAMFGGNPLGTTLYQQYQRMPTEKLHELAARAPTNPYIQRALQQRMMQPQSDPAMQAQPQQPVPGLGASPLSQTPAPMQSYPGGFAAGGGLDDDEPSMESWFGSNQPPAQAPDLVVHGQRPESSLVPTSDRRQAPSRPGLDTSFNPEPRTPAPPPRPGLDASLSPAAPDAAPASGDSGFAPEDQGTGDTAAPEHQQAGLGGTHGGGTNPWQTLLYAGLGIMGGSSPFAGVNIGKGALEGLQMAENQKLRQAQVEGNNLYRQALIPQRQQLADAATTRANAQAQNVQNTASYKQAYLSELARTHDQTAAHQAGMLAIAQQNSDLSARKLDILGQYNQWRMNHGNATAAEQQHWHEVLAQNKITDQDLRLYESFKDPTGKPVLTPQQASTQGAAVRSASTAPAARVSGVPYESNGVIAYKQPDGSFILPNGQRVPMATAGP